MPSSLFPEVSAGGSSGAEAAAIRAEGSATNSASAAATAQGYANAAAASAEGANTSASAAQGYASDAATSAGLADASADAAAASETAAGASEAAAAGSATAASDAATLAQRFAVNPIGEVFQVGEDGFLSAYHWADKAEKNAALAPYTPRRSATAGELSASKIVPGSADLFTTVAVTNASGTVACEIPVNLYVRPQLDREAWIRFVREGAGDVQITSASATVTASILGVDPKVNRWNPTGKAAGTVTTPAFKRFAGTGRYFLVGLFTLHSQTNASRAIVPTVSTGETLVALETQTYTGALNCVDFVLYGCALADAASDEEGVTVTFNNDAGLYAYAMIPVTIGGCTGGFENYNGDSDATDLAAYSRTIAPASGNRLNIFFAAQVGGSGAPATTNRGVLGATGNTGGTTAAKDLSYIVVSEQVAAAGSYTYTGTFLVSDGRSGGVVSAKPSSVSGVTIHAPGGRTKINEQWGVATVVLPGNGTLRIEGDMKA